jgi:hypothetical protein
MSMEGLGLVRGLPFRLNDLCEGVGKIYKKGMLSLLHKWRTTGGTDELLENIKSYLTEDSIDVSTCPYTESSTLTVFVNYSPLGLFDSVLQVMPYLWDELIPWSYSDVEIPPLFILVEDPKAICKNEKTERFLRKEKSLPLPPECNTLLTFLGGVLDVNNELLDLALMNCNPFHVDENGNTCATLAANMGNVIFLEWILRKPELHKLLVLPNYNCGWFFMDTVSSLLLTCNSDVQDRRNIPLIVAALHRVDKGVACHILRYIGPHYDNWRSRKEFLLKLISSGIIPEESKQVIDILSPFMTQNKIFALAEEKPDLFIKKIRGFGKSLLEILYDIFKRRQGKTMSKLCEILRDKVELPRFLKHC